MISSLYALEIKLEEDLSMIESSELHSELKFRAQKAFISQILLNQSVTSFPWHQFETKYFDQKKIDPKMTREQFYDLSRFFSSVTYKNLKPHEQKINFWEITIIGQIDEALVKTWALNYVSKTKHKYQKLWLRLNLELEGFNWDDLKLTSENDFTKSFIPLWINYLRDLKGFDVSEILFCHEDCQQNHKNWESINPKNMISEIPLHFKNSILLTQNIKIVRSTVEGAFKEYKFQLSGGFILEDLDSKNVIYYVDAKPETKSFNVKNQKELNSALASTVYRFPLGYLIEFKNSQKNKTDQMTQFLTIRGGKGLSEIYKIKEAIEIEGAGMGIEIKLDLYSQSEAKLKITLQNEAKKIKDLIQSTKAIELKCGRKFEVKEEGDQTILQLL
jgi:hypothetical protein